MGEKAGNEEEVSKEVEPETAAEDNEDQDEEPNDGGSEPTSEENKDEDQENDSSENGNKAADSKEKENDNTENLGGGIKKVPSAGYEIHPASIIMFVIIVYIVFFL